MHIYKNKRGGMLQKILFAAIFLAVVLILIIGSGSLERNTDSERAELLRQAIDNALISSYASEGYYPDSLDSLLQTYGITVDSEKYIVTYEVFAKNVRPTVRIIPIGE